MGVSEGEAGGSATTASSVVDGAAGSEAPKPIKNKKKMAAATMPTTDFSAREANKTVACMICCLVKDQIDFEDHGCDNCERFLKLAGQRGSACLYTSENYTGLIGLIDPDESWVAKWQHLGGRRLKQGMYAISVQGILPSDILADIRDAGITYFPRDKTLTESEQHRAAAGADSNRLPPRKPKRIRRRRMEKRKEKENAAKGKGQEKEGSNTEGLKKAAARAPPDIDDDNLSDEGYGAAGDNSVKGFVNQTPPHAMIHGKLEKDPWIGGGNLSDTSSDGEEIGGDFDSRSRGFTPPSSIIDVKEDMNKY